MVVLATNLALFSRLLQLPIPVGMDLLLSPRQRTERFDCAFRFFRSGED
jgi:hypothetical protein